ncbi:hypothetical protein NQ317_004787 [Molorchus minor]|uniref:Protein PET100 homolog, mitochondrial n=1 Tax=Molorchus minor TaxID=1323400 RepID=A0ABQ9JVB2_9CUCU|nr:hypothetical protein NQ317_004787 [Molorchus minor]
MGGWKLEVARMALYITFPVSLFYYFNQPQYFEKWVVKTKRELYPPESKTKRETFEQAIESVKRKQEMLLLSKMDTKDS